MSRYIDADKLRALFDNNSKVSGAFYCAEWEGIDKPSDFQDLIDAQPTADVRENVQLDVCPLYGGACGYPSGECYDCPRHGNFRENVKGEWIVKKDIINCSVCKRCSWSKSYEDLVRSFNFCPNCGADMRGDNK